MSSLHDELTLLAPAYALGALDADERRAFEAHLSTCQACTAEVRSLSRITVGLAQTPTQVSPRPELRDRILASVGASASAYRPRVVMPSAPSSRFAPWLRAAAVLLLAAGFATFAWDQRRQMRILAARLDETATAARSSEQALSEARRAVVDAQSALAVLTAPDLVRIDLAGQGDAPQASGRALWSRQRGMVFSGTNLPPLPAGRVYQVWVVTAQAPVSAGLLTPDATGGGSVYFETPVDILPPVAVAVTLEPAGGVPAPTGERYLIGTPSAL